MLVMPIARSFFRPQCPDLTNHTDGQAEERRTFGLRAAIEKELRPLFLPCAIAHELTHLLIDCVNKPGFDKREHTTNPDPTAPEACLMYKDITFANRTFFTVKFYDVVQREVAVRKNQTFGH